MKCIHCGNNNNYRDRQRNSGSCKSCRHKFAFEPYTDPLKISDSLFHRMIQGVSDDGQVFFTDMVRVQSVSLAQAVARSDNCIHVGFWCWRDWSVHSACQPLAPGHRWLRYRIRCDCTQRPSVHVTTAIGNVRQFSQRLGSMDSGSWGG